MASQFRLSHGREIAQTTPELCRFVRMTATHVTCQGTWILEGTETMFALCLDVEMLETHVIGDARTTRRCYATQVANVVLWNGNWFVHGFGMIFDVVLRCEEAADGTDELLFGFLFAGDFWTF